MCIYIYDVISFFIYTDLRTEKKRALIGLCTLEFNLITGALHGISTHCGGGVVGIKGGPLQSKAQDPNLLPGIDWSV